MVLDALLGTAEIVKTHPAYVLEGQLALPVLQDTVGPTEFGSIVVFAVRFSVFLAQILTARGRYERSITDDQASVYGEITRAMSMTGIDGTSCLQYVICEMSQRQFADDFDTVETPVWGNTTVVGGTTSGTGDWADEEANEGSNDKADLRKGGKKAPADGFSKKKRSKRSLVTDLLTALLVPKAGQPLARFVEAAAPAPLSCAARFPACPAPLALLVRRIAEL